MANGQMEESSTEEADVRMIPARKKKRQAITTIGYLPQDVVFQLLQHLPAHTLFNVERHVCREWSLIVRSPNFAGHHLRNSIGGGGILIQPWCSPRNRCGYYLEMRRGRLEVSEFAFWFNGRVWASCNGLALISRDDRGSDVYCVANPLTRRWTVLPRSLGSIDRTCRLAAAFVGDNRLTLCYKAVRLCCIPRQIHVLTIGADKSWRIIDVKHLLPMFLEDYLQFVRRYVVVTEGYVHWPSSTGIVLTMNVGTETVRRFPGPPTLMFRGDFLPMGSNLSFVSGWTRDYREVWEMSSESGEWKLLLRLSNWSFINRGIMPKRFEKSVYLSALCWLVPREVLVFGFLATVLKRGIAYNFKSGERQVFRWGGAHEEEEEEEGSVGGYYYFLVPHLNNLFMVGMMNYNHGLSL